MHKSKRFTDVVTRKHIKCDTDSIFRIHLTQLRPSAIHCKPVPTERKGSLRHVTTKNVKDLSKCVLIV